MKSRSKAAVMMHDPAAAESALPSSHGSLWPEFPPSACSEAARMRWCWRNPVSPDTSIYTRACMHTHTHTSSCSFKSFLRPLQNLKPTRVKGTLQVTQTLTPNLLLHCSFRWPPQGHFGVCRSLSSSASQPQKGASAMSTFWVPTTHCLPF